MQTDQMQEVLEAARLELDRLRMVASDLERRNSVLEAENKTLKLAQSLIPETVGIVN